MGLYIQHDSTGVGTGTVFPSDTAFMDLFAISNADGGLGRDNPVGHLSRVTYTQTCTGVCPDRLNDLVNNNHSSVPANPVDIIILAVDNNFTVNGELVGTTGGLTLSTNDPDNSTGSVLVLYDTTLHGGANYCVRGQISGANDLTSPRSVILYHELSHALQYCINPKTDNEILARTEENDMRDQLGGAKRDTNLSFDVVVCSTSSPPPPPPNCIIAKIATGYSSPEVTMLRHVSDSLLRRSQVGYRFLDLLLFEYYRFSPEVVRAMANSPELRKRIADLFVRPLSSCLALILAWSLDGSDAAAIGTRFKSDAEAGLTEADVRLALDVLDGGGALSASDWRFIELASHVDRHAESSPCIDWGLIQTIRIYLNACLWRMEGLSGRDLGERLTAAFADWAAAMPLIDIWRRLPLDVVSEELAFLRLTLLPTAESRLRFGRRLAEHIRSEESQERMTEAGFLAQRKEA